MEKCRVLLVDDEMDYREVLTRRLGKRDLIVDGVSSGEEALQYLKSIPIDVTLLDVKMPGIDGLMVLREIKKLNPLIEVIMLTGHASLEVAVEGMRLGAFDYLMKPAEIDELLYKIQDAHRAKTIREEKIANLERAKKRQGSEGVS